LVAAALVAMAMPLVAAAPAHAATTEVSGAGSTEAEIAIDQWRADVATKGLDVNYLGNGAAAGRTGYIQRQVDFAVSELPFQPSELSAASKRPYAYLPITSAGVGFMYHLDVGNQRITDLRLSTATVAKIFTGKITNWNAPAIHTDDPRYTLPSLPIKVVVRSDGAGTSWLFTDYLATVHPRRWENFCTKYTGHPAPSPPTAFYPFFPGETAQSGSDGVANAVAAPYDNGAIGYVEYGYASERNFPVARLQNGAGHFVLPTASHVATALEAASQNADGTADLTGVFLTRDPAAYRCPTTRT
jgi:ABC-type phosphate transport system substrate-binding protein